MYEAMISSDFFKSLYSDKNKKNDDDSDTDSDDNKKTDNGKKEKIVEKKKRKRAKVAKNSNDDDDIEVNSSAVSTNTPNATKTPKRQKRNHKYGCCLLCNRIYRLESFVRQIKLHYRSKECLVNPGLDYDVYDRYCWISGKESSYLNQILERCYEDNKQLKESGEFKNFLEVYQEYFDDNAEDNEQVRIHILEKQVTYKTFSDSLAAQPIPSGINQLLTSTKLIKKSSNKVGSDEKTD